MTDTNQDTIGETNVTKRKGVAIFAVSFILAIWLTIGSPENGLGDFVFLLISLLIGGFLIGTEGGRKAVKEFIDTIDLDPGNQQQQQQRVGGKTSKPTKLCSECGWKNPKGNNYCHDCGKELD